MSEISDRRKRHTMSAGFNLKKDAEYIIRNAMSDYVTKKAVPMTRKMIKEKCDRGYATGNLANSVYYDRNSDKVGSMEYTVYVEAFDKYGTNYAKFADQGRGPVRPVWAPILVWSDGSKHMYSGPAHAANFIRATISKLQ